MAERSTCGPIGNKAEGVVFDIERNHKFVRR